jgi:hypothetical protein
MQTLRRELARKRKPHPIGSILVSTIGGDWHGNGGAGNVDLHGRS